MTLTFELGCQPWVKDFRTVRKWVNTRQCLSTAIFSRTRRLLPASAYQQSVDPIRQLSGRFHLWYFRSVLPSFFYSVSCFELNNRQLTYRQQLQLEQTSSSEHGVLIWYTNEPAVFLDKHTPKYDQQLPNRNFRGLAAISSIHMRSNEHGLTWFKWVAYYTIGRNQRRIKPLGIAFKKIFGSSFLPSSSPYFSFLSPHPSAPSLLN